MPHSDASAPPTAAADRRMKTRRMRTMTSRSDCFAMTLLSALGTDVGTPKQTDKH